MFYPDYARVIRWNSLPMHAGGLHSFKSIFPSQYTISVCPRVSSVHLLSHYSFGTGVSLATRFPSCWTLKYYASSTSVECAGNSRPICYSKKRRGIADSALHYFLSHDSRLCALYFAGNTQEDISMFRETPRFQKICDASR